MNEIAIVGAGISGSITYLFLKKYISEIFPGIRIRMYEKLNAPPYHTLSQQTFIERTYQRSGLDLTHTVTGAVEIAANGVRCLKELSPQLLDRIKQFGHEFREYGVYSSSGDHLVTDDIGTDDQNNQSIFIMRADLLDILLSNVDGKDITYGVKVEPSEDPRTSSPYKNRLSLYYANDPEKRKVKPDLVIGADGPDSTVRGRLLSDQARVATECITLGAFLDEKTTRMAVNLESKMAYIPTHNLSLIETSFCRLHVIIDNFSMQNPPPEEEWHFSENPNHNFPFAGWWCTINTRYLKKIPVSKWNFYMVKDEILRRLNQEKDVNPLLLALVRASGCMPKGNILVPRPATSYGTFIKRHAKQPELDRYWGYGGRLVVVGDAAHSMPVETTQGLSLAIEDAKTIAMLLKHKFTIMLNDIKPYPSSSPLLPIEQKKKVLATMVMATSDYSKISYARYRWIMNWTKKKCPRCRGWSVMQSILGKPCDQGRFCQNSIQDLWSYKVEDAIEKTLAGEHETLHPRTGRFDTIGRSLRVCASMSAIRSSNRSKRGPESSKSSSRNNIESTHVHTNSSESQDGRRYTFDRKMGHTSYRQYCSQSGQKQLRPSLQSSTYSPPSESGNPLPGDTIPHKALQDASNSKSVSKGPRWKGKEKESNQTTESSSSNQHGNFTEPPSAAAPTGGSLGDSYVLSQSDESYDPLKGWEPFPPLTEAQANVAIGNGRPRPDSAAIPNRLIVPTGQSDESTENHALEQEERVEDEDSHVHGDNCTHGGPLPSGPNRVV